MTKKKQNIKPYNFDLKQKARHLRRNMTKAEIILWSYLRRKQINGIRFLRQRPIGHYIVDFYAPEAKLVIELDGGQHFSEEQIVYDKTRTVYLQNEGLKVIRFTNTEVFDHIKDVVVRIGREVA